MDNPLKGRADSVAVSLASRADVASAVTRISGLLQRKDSIRVSLRGPVSAAIDLLQKISAGGGEVSAVFTARGDKTARE